MDQVIQYLYEYDKGERVRNLGFMKVDHRMDKLELQIFAKELDEVRGIWFRKPDGTHYIAAWEAIFGELAGYTAPVEPCEEPKNIDETGYTAPETRCDTLEDSYIPPINRRFEKIQRQDLSRLPRKEWRLANNNFLLHGYYNYHHLMLIEDEGTSWLGVPGIYHEKEKEAAEMFGFPEFIRMTDFEVELLPEEKNTMDDFGYWCRQVEQL